MFGAISYWPWQSRASVASSAASSYECYRSRANSNASNCNFPNLKQNIDWHCSNCSLSENYRLTPQNSFPIGTKCSMSDCLSTVSRNNSITAAHRLSLQRSSIQPASLAEQQLQSHVNEIDASFIHQHSHQHKQMKKNQHTFSIEGTNPNQNYSNAEEAYIISFQRELQNLPKSSAIICENSNQNTTINDSAAANTVIRETFENVGNQFKRPRSRSVPRVTLENFPTVLLHLPKNPIIQTQQQQEKNQLPCSTSSSSSSRMNAFCKSTQSAAIDIRSNNQIFNFSNCL
ncbi:hypothetical protein BLA29_004741 [Euroglyphus maynei]|uniref:Uncharacterized protein n=1 Tax=Euroglyphus maynei TaxID=6958 RepID=A0A1Y3B8W8_EURMA|nr:hypothetical protein BLA29_004741 [Euroglyphus maynei]